VTRRSRIRDPVLLFFNVTPLLCLTSSSSLDDALRPPPPFFTFPGPKVDPPPRSPSSVAFGVS